MSRTIDDFRNFFKSSEEKQTFKIKEVIDKVVSLVYQQLKDNNIEIEIECEDIEYIGYENELEQVLINIVHNGKDALLQAKVPDKKIAVNAFRKDKNIKIEISDNGGGIEKGVMDKIFDPYYTTKFKSQGTGLGLYMSKMIVEKNMQGKLGVKNAPDGAVFTIKLPLTKDEQ